MPKKNKGRQCSDKAFLCFQKVRQRKPWERKIINKESKEKIE